MNRTLWVLTGVAMTLALISAIGFAAGAYYTAGDFSEANTAFANNENNSPLNEMEEEMDGMEECPMHSNGFSNKSMKSMMQEMDCMGMDIEEMDSDGDGKCDYCGMSIQECEKMEEMHKGENNTEMHSGNIEMHSEMMEMH